MSRALLVCGVLAFVALAFLRSSLAIPGLQNLNISLRGKTVFSGGFFSPHSCKTREQHTSSHFSFRPPYQYVSNVAFFKSEQTNVL